MMNVRSTVWLFLVGCAPAVSVQATVGGASPKLTHGYFTEDVGLGIVQIRLTEYFNPCAVDALLASGFREAADLDATPEVQAATLAAVWADVMPERFWGLDLTLVVEDLSEPLSGDTITGVPHGAVPTFVDEAEASATVSFVDGPLGADHFLDGRSDAFQAWSSDLGRVDVASHVPHLLLEADLVTTLREGDGDAAGAGSFTFLVGRCTDLEPDDEGVIPDPAISDYPPAGWHCTHGGAPALLWIPALIAVLGRRRGPEGRSDRPI